MKTIPGEASPDLFRFGFILQDFFFLYERHICTDRGTVYFPMMHPKAMKFVPNFFNMNSFLYVFTWKFCEHKELWLSAFKPRVSSITFITNSQEQRAPVLVLTFCFGDHHFSLSLPRRILLPVYLSVDEGNGRGHEMSWGRNLKQDQTETGSRASSGWLLRIVQLRTTPLEQAVYFGIDSTDCVLDSGCAVWVVQLTLDFKSCQWIPHLHAYVKAHLQSFAWQQLQRFLEPFQRDSRWFLRASFKMCSHRYITSIILYKGPGIRLYNNPIYNSYNL